jgi:hypothetical protein
VVNSTHRPFYTVERDPVSIVQEAGWDLGLVWTCAENLAPAGIRFPDRPARSESLYRLSYLGPSMIIMMMVIIIIIIIVIITNSM